MVPQSAVSSLQAPHLVLSGQLVKFDLGVVAGMLFQPPLLLLVIHNLFLFFVSDLPLLLIQFPPFLCQSVHILISRDVAVSWDQLEHCLSVGVLQYRHGTGSDDEGLVLWVG